MARSKRTADQAVLSVLRRGPQRGLTAAVVAERAGLNISTTRNVLYTLTSENTVRVVGVNSTGSVGRPAHLYAL